ncbi:CMRF35-like molecule 1 isoform X2 [Lemur catta]|uniref:CMRF35-like molecule 1 isoform X2 n=1 Tax=Lemur catta TaxID=9447 RepID=UPI001E26E6F1|nr:CMRF35-like molecule 1 isoform X2 [Lemur catta]
MHLLTLFLLLFWLSGYSTAGDPITGPGAASGPEQGSLTVQCRYDPEWETHKKWWCRGAVWSSCEILVRTTGSEQEVRKDRVSLRDNQKNHTFTVTMEELRRNDADTYWCGIERTGVDRGVPVKVAVDPAPTTVSTAAPTTSTSTTNTVTGLVIPEKTDGSSTLTSYPLGDRAPRSEVSRAANHRPSGHKAWHHEAQHPHSPHLCHIAASLGGRLTPGLEDGETPEESWDASRAGSLSETGSFLCISDFGQRGSGADLYQHRPAHPPHPRHEPRGPHGVQHPQEVLAWSHSRPVSGILPCLPSTLACLARTNTGCGLCLVSQQRPQPWGLVSGGCWELGVFLHPPLSHRAGEGAGDVPWGFRCNNNHDNDYNGN